jgi:hypothetical protein
MKNTASTYNIETPDTVYYSYDLTHFDYFVGSYRGQTLLMANCTFEEIMDGGEVIIANGVSGRLRQITTKQTIRALQKQR